MSKLGRVIIIIITTSSTNLNTDAIIEYFYVVY